MGIKEPATSGYFQRIRVKKIGRFFGISNPFKELAFFNERTGNSFHVLSLLEPVANSIPGAGTTIFFPGLVPWAGGSRTPELTTGYKPI